MAEGSTFRALKRKQRERVFKRKMFYASLGECITAWATIERHIFDLFDRALFGLKGDKKKSALLFWTLPTFGMRLSYTSMLVMHCLKTGDGKLTKDQKYWKKLNKDLENLSSFRNNLAHQPAAKDRVMPPDDEDRGWTVIRVKEMIVPNKLDRKKSFKPIEHADLEAHLKAVSEIRVQLKHVYMSLPGWEESALATLPPEEDEEDEDGVSWALDEF